MDIEQLYLSYIKDIYRYLYSLCKHTVIAEDLMQDTFYKAHITLLHIQSKTLNHGYLK